MIESVGSMYAQQVLQGGRAEVVVARDRNPFNFPLHTEFDSVDDCDFFGAGGLALVIDLHVEIPQALEIVAQTAITFVQKVFVDCTFLIDL